jgi:hypothetical protein
MTTVRLKPKLIDRMVPVDEPSTEKNPLTAQHQATSRPSSSGSWDSAVRFARSIPVGRNMPNSTPMGNNMANTNTMRAPWGHAKATLVIGRLMTRYSRVTAHNATVVAVRRTRTFAPNLSE